MGKNFKVSAEPAQTVYAIVLPLDEQGVSEEGECTEPCQRVAAALMERIYHLHRKAPQKRIHIVICVQEGVHAEAFVTVLREYLLALVAEEPDLQSEELLTVVDMKVPQVKRSDMGEWIRLVAAYAKEHDARLVIYTTLAMGLMVLALAMVALRGRYRKLVAAHRLIVRYVLPGGRVLNG